MVMVIVLLGIILVPVVGSQLQDLWRHWRRYH